MFLIDFYFSYFTAACFVHGVSPFRDGFAGSFYAKKQRHDERLPPFFGLSGYAYTERAKRARKKEKGKRIKDGG